MIFNEKIGNALFVQFCSKKQHYSVPIVFYQQIEEYKAANVDPEELLRLAKDIYDQFVMRELLIRQRRKEKDLRTPNSSPLPKEEASKPGELDDDSIQGLCDAYE